MKIKLAFLFYGKYELLFNLLYTVYLLEFKSMHIIIWEYTVKPEREEEFVKLYNSKGDWDRLFKKSNDYINTIFLKQVDTPFQYTTIDKWKTKEAYELFLDKYKLEYAKLDQQGGSLTVSENRLTL